MNQNPFYSSTLLREAARHLVDNAARVRTVLAVTMEADRLRIEYPGCGYSPVEVENIIIMLALRHGVEVTLAPTRR